MRKASKASARAIATVTLTVVSGLMVAPYAFAQAPLPPLPQSQPQPGPAPAPQPPPQGYPPPPPQGYPPPPQGQYPQQQPQQYPQQQQQYPQQQGGYAQPQYPPPQYGPTPQYQQPPQYQQQPSAAVPPPPPRVDYTEPPEPTHAPKFSLWAGGRLGFLGFGGNFYTNSAGPGGSGATGETTGNFVKNGLSTGLDVGARLGKRYVPYLFIEHGFMGQGHRFEGSDATSSTDLLGVGFRYTAGDVDSAGFLTDISIGMRSVTVKGGTETYKMQSLEFFRLGLGAEIRISTLFVISPMATISSGTMNDTSGSATYSAAGSGDGEQHPTYQNGKQIDNQRAYVIVGIHCGAHFDIFGK